ncbi:hypothetical protein B0H63DRAFT_423049 [Podospora didyma]|uniref:SET domain-containing protein n=1 Tax=Podospora didyma TaxID=330526 RepID=A0AAE0K2X3_9PEZI|nr:hypothetical protein B0H63DRAFT_423049 [Podospora didyma]
MAWAKYLLTRALVLGLLAQGIVADGDADANAKADVAPSVGSDEGLAFEPIEKTEIYTDNATAKATTPEIITDVEVPPVEGWWQSKICSGVYCIFTNRRINNGRGLVIVSKIEDFHKVERVEDHLEKAENKYEEPISWQEAEVVDKGIGLVANKTLRRGKTLMSWSPVLMVHKDVMNEVRKADRLNLLERAVTFLPDATRAKFDRQRAGGPKGDITRTVEQIIKGAPFEIDLGFARHADDHSKHYVNYPEISAVFQHDCRPNVAYHVDNNLALRTVIARRTSVGEELTIAYIDPLEPRAERQAWVKKNRGYGIPCPCDACNKKGRLDALKESEDRVAEILSIRAELRNHDSKIITFDMIERFLKLLDQERLQVKLAEAYELAAVNFNYLGDDVRAKKYADLAVQAGMIEGGVDSNDVIAMRIMASDVKGHYSYRFTLKRRGQ